MIFGFITAIVFTTFIGYAQSIVLTDLGVPAPIVMLIGFLIGLMLPGRIVSYIYKEELEAMQSPKDEE